MTSCILLAVTCRFAYSGRWLSSPAAKARRDPLLYFWNRFLIRIKLQFQIRMFLLYDLVMPQIIHNFAFSYLYLSNQTSVEMNIRLEIPADYREVENLTREAFWNIYRPGCTEHFVLNQYRKNPDFMPQLDFVMEEGTEIIGHVMFSKAIIQKEGGGSLPAWTFGPISIRPNYQRKGYGLKLLKYALEKAKEAGVAVVCMEGKIDFYKHAGFVLASSLGIHYHSEPKDSDVPYFLAKELVPGYLDSVEGTYSPPKGYFVAEERPDAFEEYEATFPKKEKHLLKGQLPQFCQSCGMPLTEDAVCGTNADGSTNFDYCQYCFKDGAFTLDCSMEEMADHCSQFVDKYNEETGENLTREAYKDVLLGFYPMLKRWRTPNHADFQNKQ